MLSIRAKLFGVLGILLLSLLTVPKAAHAEPVGITTGFVGVTSNIRDIISFNFSGNGLSASGLDSHAPPSVHQYSSPCLTVPKAAHAAPVGITTGFVGVTSNIRDIISFNFSGN